MAYVRDVCRCAPCKTAASRYEKRRSYLTATGRCALVDAEAARLHVRHLIEAGLTISQIEQRSGIHRTGIRVLIGDWPGRQPSQRIRRVNAAALLAITPDRLGPELSGLVDGAGTMRRLEALQAFGWPASLIAARLGAQTPQLQIGRSVDGLVLAGTAAKVRTLYDELSMTHGHSRASVRRAQHRGWLPPLAWDDDCIDDPTYSPGPETAPTTHGRAREIHADDVEFLHLDGMTLDGICARLRCSTTSLQTVLIRRGRADLWQEITQRKTRSRTMPRRVA